MNVKGNFESIIIHIYNYVQLYNMYLAHDSGKTQTQATTEL